MPLRRSIVFAFMLVAACFFAPAAVGAGAPDLRLLSMSNPPATLVPQQTFRVTVGVKNGGTARAAATTTAFRLSTDRLPGKGDLQLRAVATPALAPKRGTRLPLTLKLPASIAQGTYYLIACADSARVAREATEANNCRSSATRVRVVRATLRISAPAERAITGPAVVVVFDSNVAVTTSCSVDGTAAVACSSGSTLTMGDGTHTIVVSGTDVAGNHVSAARSIVVDAVAPTPRFTSGPASLTATSAATVAFASDDAAASFTCAVDAATAAPCASPFTTANLGDGAHAIVITATDAVGNAARATRNFTTDTTAPNTIFVATEPSPTDDATADFTFVADEAGSTFECKLDGASFTTCTSPHSTGNLVDGSHTFSVRATDAAGNVEGTPASYTFTVALPDTTAPAAPNGLQAGVADGRVDISWNANSELDLAGYRVYRSATLPVPISGTPLNGATLLITNSYRDATTINGSTWHYAVVAVDGAGNASTGSAAVTATLPTPLDVHINFQPAAATVPDGYVADTGAAFSDALGRGWVRQDSLNAATHVPISVASTARERNLLSDQRLDTFLHMQFQSSTPAAWEYVVPNGTYLVTVAVGDAGTEYDSVHRVRAEGATVLADFAPTADQRNATASRVVNVQDGRLTLDAIGGANTKIDYVDFHTLSTSHPEVTSTSPTDIAIGVLRDAAITAEVNMPNVGAGIDPATLTASSVRLVRVSDDTSVPAQRNTTGGGDAIVVRPTSPLAAFTKYRFEVLATLHDTSGASFVARSVTFTTGAATSPPPAIEAAFEQVQQPTAQGRAYTSITFGPDDKLYAGTYDGTIVRWPVASDGTLGTAEVLNALTTAKGPRAILGLTFDPSSTSSNLILWVTDNQAVYEGGDDWTGQITRLSGPALGTVQTWVTGLPRSVADHETNSIAFGPDGAMYFSQGSNSAMGAADTVWGNRPERLLSAAVLRLQPSAVAQLPLDARTEAGGSYDPYAPGAPLTIYATGLRNAYDLVWHTNGNLYSPGNGSAAGGATPATPNPLPASCAHRIDAATNGAFTGPSIPGIGNVVDSEHDYAFTVRAGGYYGHPNPLRCEWVLAGGNPTAGPDSFEIGDYPVGTAPDRNFRLTDTFDMGVHQSPDGAIEWKGSQFNGALDHKLLVARYSAGKDVVVLDPSGTDGAIANQTTGIPGLTGLVDPLDLAQRPGTGQLYVTELGAGRVTLLRAVPPSSHVVATPTLLAMSDTTGDASGSAAHQFHVENTGTASSTLTSLAITGAQASAFSLVAPPALPYVLAPGASVDIGVQMLATTDTIADATLTISSTGSPAAQTISLRGIGVGADEPSLQRILDTWRINVNVGDTDPDTSDMPIGGTLGQEITAQRFTRAAPGNVTIEALDSFVTTGPGGIITQIGWIPAGTPATVNPLITIATDQASKVAPDVTGTQAFDPGTAPFSFRSSWAANSNAIVHQEDALNTFPGAFPHHVRVYPLRTADGTPVANAYVLGFEAITAAADYQDIVLVVRNVTPA